MAISLETRLTVARALDRQVQDLRGPGGPGFPRGVTHAVGPIPVVIGKWSDGSLRGLSRAVARSMVRGYEPRRGSARK